MDEDVELSPSQRCCTLSITCGDDVAESTCCGILLDTRHGIILTHASLLSQVLTFNSVVLKDLKQEHFSQSKQLSQFKVEVLFQEIVQDNLEEDISLLSRSKLTPNFLTSQLNSNSGFVRFDASVKCIFQSWSLKQIIAKLLPAGSWDFVESFSEIDQGNEKHNKNQNSPTFYSLLPCFLILKLKDWKPFESTLDIRSSVNNRQGDRVEIQSTPFGSVSPDVFFNSRSQGIISNLSGKNGILILTDARCIPGAEGGALYFCDGKQRVLTGIVLATLCWKHNEWVGLSLAAALSEILDNLSHLPLKWPAGFYRYLNTVDSQWLMPRMIESAHRNIPLVSVAGNWGSGVCVGHNRDGQRVILTCSHVIGKGRPTSVELVYKPDPTPHQADVVYQVPVGQQFDLAVLLEQRMTHLHGKLARRATSSQGNLTRWATNPQGNLARRATSSQGNLIRRATSIHQGESVFVIGHALFGRGIDLEPTVTMGIVSKVIKVTNQPVMLQTTCAVHAGASGGAVIDSDGRLAGIVVCNARDTATGASYPHVNMCIPIATIGPVLDTYMTTGDTEVLRSLCSRNPRIHGLWTLDNFKGGRSAQDSHVLTSKL